MGSYAKIDKNFIKTDAVALILSYLLLKKKKIIIINNFMIIAKNGVHHMLVYYVKNMESLPPTKLQYYEANWFFLLDSVPLSKHMMNKLNS